MPFWKFVIQIHTWTATTAGIAHASTSPVVRSTRTGPERRTSSCASRRPSTIVSATFAAVNTIVRTRVSQNTSSPSTER